MKRPVLPDPTRPGQSIVILTKGFTARISTEDALEVGRFNWSVTIARGVAYGVRNAGGRPQLLHRFIGARMGLSLAAEVDHADGDGLNDVRSNLRDATHAQNMWNSKLMSTNRSGTKGVSWYGGKWVAEIMVDRRKVRLGRFDTADEATRCASEAYDRLHGEFNRRAA